MLKKELKINDESVCSIFLECNYSEMNNFIKNKETIITISDTNIYNLYKSYFNGYYSIILEPGEKTKSFETVNYIISKLLEHNVDKSYILVAIGGGTICDITGFTASIYKRGINFAYVPTTILAQIDAAIGGKTAVNFNGVKNCIGSFKLPQFVMCNSSVIDTLPEIEVKSAFGEVLKYSLISEDLPFEELAKKNFDFFIKNRHHIYDLTSRCIDIKINIVKQDFNDNGIRRILNFGHTFGHAFEIIEDIPHGIAVLKGICVAIDLSYKLGLLKKDKLDLIKECIINYGFDTDYTINDEIIEIILQDKKNTKKELNLILLENIASPIIVKLEINKLLALLHDKRN